MDCERFRPGRVDGLSGVDEVAVYADRLELRAGADVRVIPFVTMVRWPWPRVFWKMAFRIGLRHRWLPVADRDWCHDPQERYFDFYTEPRVRVYMPKTDGTGYEGTCFQRIKDVMLAGGFHSHDSA